MGISAPILRHVKDARNNDSLSPKFLISNSWHQDPDNFYLRGGLESIKAFSEIKATFPSAELTIRASLPENLPQIFRKIIEHCNVRIIDNFLPADEWEALKLATDFFLILSKKLSLAITNSF